MTDTTKAALDAALRLGNGRMPIVVEVQPGETADAAAYIRGRHGCRALSFKEKEPKK